MSEIPSSKEALEDEKVEVLSRPENDNGVSLLLQEKRLVRKIDIRLLPITCLLYLSSGEAILLLFSIHLMMISPTSSSGQVKSWECPTTGPTWRYSWRRRLGKEVRLGYFCLLLFLCEFRV